MTIKVVTGDLLALAEAGQFDVIAHGCNCFHTMGGGIARQIAARYPSALDADKDTVKGDRSKLGAFTISLQIVKTAAGGNVNFWIANLYTQYSVSSHGEDVFEYEHFTTALKQLRVMFNGKRFGLPKIGCGLAGGDEKLIMATIEHYLKDQDVTIVEFKG